VSATGRIRVYRHDQERYISMASPTADTLRDEPPASELSVAQLARAVVAETAPDELPYFDKLATVYAANPAEAVNPRSRDQLGGAGVLDLLANMLTIIVLDVLAHLAANRVEKGVESAKQEAKKRGWRLPFLKGRPKKSADLEEKVTLPATPDEAAEARSLLMTLSVQCEIPTELAQRAALQLSVVLTGRGPGPIAPAAREDR
jgi:hypothetical protein